MMMSNEDRGRERVSRRRLPARERAGVNAFAVVDEEEDEGNAEFVEETRRPGRRERRNRGREAREYAPETTAMSVPLAAIAPALVNKAVTPVADGRLSRRPSIVSTVDARRDDRGEMPEVNPATKVRSRRIKKAKEVKYAKRKKARTRGDTDDSHGTSDSGPRKRGSRLGCCARLVLSLSAFILGLMFVVGPILFVAGVRSGQVDRVLLEQIGVAPWLEDAGILKKRSAVKPKLGFITNFFASQLSDSGPTPLHDRPRQPRRDEERPLSRGDESMHPSSGEQAAAMPGDTASIEPNALATAQDWLVSAIGFVQHRVREKLAKLTTDTDAGSHPEHSQESGDGKGSPGVLGAEERDDELDFGITAEQVQEELAALWKSQQEMFESLRDQLSQVSVASILSQHRSEPGFDPETDGDDQIDQGNRAQPATFSPHTPQEVRSAIERQRAAEEMGRLKVKSAGPVHGVRKMLNGEGIPYDPQIPWASV